MHVQGGSRNVKMAEIMLVDKQHPGATKSKINKTLQGQEYEESGRQD